MRINIQTTPHDQQRYDTVGDYWIDDEGVIQVRVSDLGDEDMEFLVALHELVEMRLCHRQGIDFKAIDNFDRSFEEIRVKHPYIIGLQEPGDMVSAPYHTQHQHATSIEQLMASYLGVNWGRYDKAVNELTAKR